jgi:hypothetical protein
MARASSVKAAGSRCRESTPLDAAPPNSTGIRPLKNPAATPFFERPRHLHPLAAPHHPPLGRTPLSYTIARAHADHTDTTGAATTTYIKTTLQEVALTPNALFCRIEDVSSCVCRQVVHVWSHLSHGASGVISLEC